MGTVWILTADRGGARVYATRSPGCVELESVLDVGSEEGRLTYGEVYADRQGRFAGDGAHGGSGDRRQDLAHQAADRLAHRLVAWLESARNAGRFEELMIMAAPMMLGTLRGVLPRPLSHLVTREVAKDVANLNEADRRAQVRAFARER